MKSKFSQNHIYISTYHFIRNSRDRFYKNINFLDYSKFKIQINYFKRMFNLINFEDTSEILNSKRNDKKPFSSELLMRVIEIIINTFSHF